jgi:hypothetical protein
VEAAAKTERDYVNYHSHNAITTASLLECMTNIKSLNFNARCKIRKNMYGDEIELLTEIMPSQS